MCSVPSAGRPATWADLCPTGISSHFSLKELNWTITLSFHVCPATLAKTPPQRAPVLDVQQAVGVNDRSTAVGCNNQTTAAVFRRMYHSMSGLGAMLSHARLHFFSAFAMNCRIDCCSFKGTKAIFLPVLSLQCCPPDLCRTPYSFHNSFLLLE